MFELLMAVFFEPLIEFSSVFEVNSQRKGFKLSEKREKTIGKYVDIEELQRN